jgi:hypothetical protein
MWTMQNAKQLKLAQNAADDRRKDASLHAAAGAGGSRASRAQTQLARRTAAHRERDAKVEAKANAKAGKVMRAAKQKVRPLQDMAWLSSSSALETFDGADMTISWRQPVVSCSMQNVSMQHACMYASYAQIQLLAPRLASIVPSKMIALCAVRLADRKETPSAAARRLTWCTMVVAALAGNHTVHKLDYWPPASFVCCQQLGLGSWLSLRGVELELPGLCSSSFVILQQRRTVHCNSMLAERLRWRVARWCHVLVYY